MEPKVHLIPKKSSGVRIIHDFEDSDKHTEILSEVRDYYRCRDYTQFVYGYPSGNRSLKNTVELFLAPVYAIDPKFSGFLISIDINDFYSSISKEAAKLKIPEEVWELGLETAFVDIGNKITCLSQGSPLSPDIANIFLFDFDLAVTSRLQHIVQKMSYMRYVDNLYFLVEDPHIGLNIKNVTKHLSLIIAGILAEFGLSINPKKTSIQQINGDTRVSLLGLNCTSRVKRKRRDVDKLRACLFNTFVNGKQLSKKDLGRLSYTLWIDPHCYVRFTKAFNLLNSEASNKGLNAAALGIYNKAVNKATQTNILNIV